MNGNIAVIRLERPQEKRSPKGRGQRYQRVFYNRSNNIPQDGLITPIAITQQEQASSGELW